MPTTLTNVVMTRRRAVSSGRLRGMTERMGSLNDACEVSCRVRAVRWPGRCRGFTPRTTYYWCRPKVGPPLLLQNGRGPVAGAGLGVATREVCGCRLGVHGDDCTAGCQCCVPASRQVGAVVTDEAQEANKSLSPTANPNVTTSARNSPEGNRRPT